MLQLNRCIRLPLRPQERRALPAKCNPRAFSIGCFGGYGDQIAYNLLKSNRVRQIIHHHSRKRYGNIQRKIPSLFNGGNHIHAVIPQTLKNASPMRLSRDRDNSTPGTKGGFDEPGKASYKCRLIRIEFGLVTVCDLQSFRSWRWERLLRVLDGFRIRRQDETVTR